MQPLGSADGVGFPNSPDAVIGIQFPGTLDCLPQLAGVVTVIVENQDVALLANQVKSSACAVEINQSISQSFYVQAKQMGCGQGCRRIEYIKLSWEG